MRDPLEQKIDLTHIKFEPLGNHDRAAFSCGDSAMDNYLRTQASQDIKKRAAAVYVATSDGKTILGFYTLSQYSVHFDDIPQEIAKKFARYNTVSATLLGRLARHISTKGSGFGELLLIDALHRAFRMSRQIASAAVVVDAKNEHAMQFYRRYGFMELPKIVNRLFIPMATIEKLISKQD